jgi:uncharacterized protein YabN with tetrapyrrole methylase and pyrophosphatase domain
MEMSKTGTLIAVGTGIHIGQITVEAREWLQIADKVLYCVSDAATEKLIVDLNNSAESMYCYYGEGKRRMQTYEEMISRTLSALQSHEVVVVAYYGHPGFFVYPSHRAIKIAREAGYRAFMLPGVSSFDCLIADLGISVSQGCQIFEATDLMLRRRQLDTSSHIVILQVSALGELGYSFKGFDYQHLGTLGEFLMQSYPPEFVVKAYHAAQFAITEARVDELSIADLANANIKHVGTLYIPPLRSATLHLKVLRQYKLESLLDQKRLVPLNSQPDGPL